MMGWYTACCNPPSKARASAPKITSTPPLVAVSALYLVSKGARTTPRTRNGSSPPYSSLMASSCASIQSARRPRFLSAAPDAPVISTNVKPVEPPGPLPSLPVR
eukprot:scaffold44086_cov63-Phaeocystis_antarctica.AAC.4